MIKDLITRFSKKVDFFQEDVVEQRSWINFILCLPLFAFAIVVAITYAIEIAFLIFILAIFMVIPNAYKKKLMEDFSFNQKQISYCILLIILLAFFLRIYNLDAESLWLDEALSVEHYAKNDITTIIERLSVHPPLYYIILHFWIKLFGDSEFSVRFLSAIFGIMSIYVIYRLGKLIFDDNVGIISALLLSISLFHINYSQEVRFYSLLTLLALLSNYYFIKILKERSIKNTAAYAISTVAMPYTHIFGLFYIMFQNIFYLLAFRKNIKYWITTQIIILLFLAPWIPILLRQVTRAETEGLTEWIPRPTFITLYNTFGAFAGGDISLYFFMIVIVVGIVIGAYKLAPSRKLDDMALSNYRIFLLSWLFIPILISFTVSLIVQPIYISKYLIGSLPAFYILTSKIILNFRKQFAIIGIILIISLLTIGSIQKYYSTPEKEQWRELVDYIDRNEGKNDIVLLQAPYSAFEYYSKKIGIATNYVETWRADKINKIIKDKNGVWLVFSHGNESTLNLIKDEINKTHILQYEMLWQFRGIHAWYYITKDYKVDQIQKNQPNAIPLTGSNQKIAQSFIPRNEYIDAIQLKIHKYTSPVRISIQTDNNDMPSGIELGHVAIEPLAYSMFIVEFDHIKLNPNDMYWIVIERNTDNGMSFVGEGGGNTDVLMVYDIIDNKWKNFYWGNRSGNGLYFKTMYLQKSR